LPPPAGRRGNAEHRLNPCGPDARGSRGARTLAADGSRFFGLGSVHRFSNALRCVEWKLCAEPRIRLVRKNRENVGDARKVELGTAAAQRFVVATPVLCGWVWGRAESFADLRRNLDGAPFRDPIAGSR